MQIALEDLGLSFLQVVHTGQNVFPLSPKIVAVPVAQMVESVRLPR